MAEAERNCDVAIVGGGPAGLAAAVALKEAGVGSVVVVERENEIGGIPRHCGHFPFGMREFGRVLRGPDYAARLAAQARKAGAEVMLRASVVGVERGPVLSLSTPEGAMRLHARRVLLATGVRENSRAARLIGGTRPGGIVSTGALQGLVYLDGIRPFRRPVIIGTELVAFSALLTCRHLGIRPVAIIEAGERVTAFSAAGLLPQFIGTALHLGTRVVAINGVRQVESVNVEDRSGALREIEADGVIVSGQFLPEASLLAGSHLMVDAATGGPAVDQFGRCSDPDFFAAGNLLRAVETAGWSWAEGRAVAEHIVRSLDGRLAAPATRRRVTVGGPLKYVVPQAVDDNRVDGSERFQLRVSRAVNGRLRLAVDGQEVWSRRLRALPERRITVPLSVLSAGGTEAVFSIEDA